jgi:hypothetical protein
LVDFGGVGEKEGVEGVSVGATVSVAITICRDGCAAFWQAFTQIEIARTAATQITMFSLVSAFTLAFLSKAREDSGQRLPFLKGAFSGLVCVHPRSPPKSRETSKSVLAESAE